MANNLPTPPAVAAPFAALSSARNPIPPLSQTTFGGATLQQGFPPETSLPLSSGGIPPSRKDLNGMGYIATFPQYFLQMGGYYTYDPNVASAIDGYPKGAILTWYNSSTKEVRKLRSLVANNTRNFVTSPSVVGTYWEDVTPIVGVGRTMFEFFWNFTREIPAGALQLNGQNLSGCNSSTSKYYAFYTEGKRLAAAGKLAKKSMAEYVSDLETYGECNAFVFDQNNDGTAQTGRMRIPTIKGFIQAGVPGNIHNAGLPNIYGKITTNDSSTGDAQKELLTYADSFVSSGALRLGDKDSATMSLGSDKNTGYRTIAFNASWYNSIYGAANTVQPKSVELVPCIQYTPGQGTTSGGASSGITSAQASAIAIQTVNNESFNPGGYWNFLGGIAVAGEAVATVNGVSGAYLPSSGNWTATVSSGGYINQLSMGSAGAVVRRIHSSDDSGWRISSANVALLNVDWRVTSMAASGAYVGSDGAGGDDIASGAITSNYITSDSTSSGDGDYVPLIFRYGLWAGVNGKGDTQLSWQANTSNSITSSSIYDGNGYPIASGAFVFDEYFDEGPDEPYAWGSTHISADLTASASAIGSSGHEYAGGGVASVGSAAWVNASDGSAPTFTDPLVTYIDSNGLITVEMNGQTIASGYGPHLHSDIIIPPESAGYFNTSGVSGQTLRVDVYTYMESGGTVSSGEFNIYDELASGSAAQSGGITSADAAVIASNVVAPVSGGLQSQINALSSGAITSGAVQQIASGAAVDVIGASALPKDSAWTTTVGNYTMTYTSNGGLTVSYHDYDEEAGVDTIQSAVFAGGNITLGGSNDGNMEHYRIATGDGALVMEYGNDSPDSQSLVVGIGGIIANGSAITQATIEFDGTSLGIEELSGGVKYFCSSALSALSVGSVASGCNAAFFFTVASGAVVTLPAPWGTSRFFGEYPNSSGTSYCLAINGDMAVCVPAASAGV